MFIPQQVKDAIVTHLNSSITKGLKGYESAFEDEDVLTGHLFGQLKIDDQKVVIDNPEIGGIWKWSIDYKKFGGRGKGATESIIGADGIFELSLYKNDEEIKKSLLFQSKLDWRNKDKKLYVQSSKLATWLGAAVILNYTQEQVETYSINEILASQGTKPTNMKPLNTLLGVDFINCHIGDSDLEYNAVTKKLIWLDKNSDIVATNFNLRRRLKIKVIAPKKGPYQDRKIDKTIDNKDISKHQLKTSLNDFSIDNSQTLEELRKVKNKLSMAFHPDKHTLLPKAQYELFSDLMQYFNNKIDTREKNIILQKNKK